eukprot:TRINITY_DN12805_c0_g1_i1.p1 TRINITY_DN12805_c0_g1~~TRINITY_DN12805_c0_g1_i1.p1  ORF type:complete len:115 (+),score=1.83 TRINITY_DN12805_c0_g1_i1:171-515(+)
MADKTSGLINGAMRFDGEHLEPLYQLEIGRPGSSFAFEIAQKIGLPKGVIDRAKEKLGTQQVNFEKLLKELDIEKTSFLREKHRDWYQSAEVGSATRGIYGSENPPGQRAKEDR